MHKIIIALLIMMISLPVFASRTIVQRNPYYYGFHSPYYNNYYAQNGKFRQTYSPDEYYYPKQTPLKKIKNYFLGELTGYTPNLDDNTFYQPSNYGNRKYSTYTSPWGNGYRYDDYSTGSSTGIRILD